MISGAVSQTYTVTQNGIYSVTVSNGYCSSTSSLNNVTTVNTNAIVKENKIIIYPNPNNGKFRIQMDHTQSGTIKVYNAIGEIVYESAIIDSEINLSGYAYGVYSVQISTAEKIYVGNVIIQ